MRLKSKHKSIFFISLNSLIINESSDIKRNINVRFCDAPKRQNAKPSTYWKTKKKFFQKFQKNALQKRTFKWWKFIYVIAKQGY